MVIEKKGFTWNASIQYFIDKFHLNQNNKNKKTHTKDLINKKSKIVVLFSYHGEIINTKIRRVTKCNQYDVAWFISTYYIVT